MKPAAVLCKNPQCGAVVQGCPPNRKLVSCPQCRTVTCTSCGAVHEGMSCKSYQATLPKSTPTPQDSGLTDRTRSPELGTAARRTDTQGARRPGPPDTSKKASFSQEADAALSNETSVAGTASSGVTGSSTMPSAPSDESRRLQNLLQRQKVLRRKASRILTDATQCRREVSQNELRDVAGDSDDIRELIDRLLRIDKDMRAVDDQVLSLVDKERGEQECETTEDYLDQISSMVSRLRSVLERLREREARQKTGVPRGQAAQVVPDSGGVTWPRPASGPVATDQDGAERPTAAAPTTRSVDVQRDAKATVSAMGGNTTSLWTSRERLAQRTSQGAPDPTRGTRPTPTSDSVLPEHGGEERTTMASSSSRNSTSNWEDAPGQNTTSLEGEESPESKREKHVRCKAGDCEGQLYLDADAQQFECPVCELNNCLNCDTVHPEFVTCEEHKAVRALLILGAILEESS